MGGLANLPKRVGDRSAAIDFVSVRRVQFLIASAGNHGRQEELAAQESSGLIHRSGPSNFHRETRPLPAASI